MVPLSETNTHAPPLRRNQRSLTATLLLAATLLTGCGGDDYCGAVEAHQAELTDVTASGSPAALLEALPIFRDLQEEAPDDIRDEWTAFLDPLTESLAKSLIRHLPEYINRLRRWLH